MAFQGLKNFFKYGRMNTAEKFEKGVNKLITQGTQAEKFEFNKNLIKSQYKAMGEKISRKELKEKAMELTNKTFYDSEKGQFVDFTSFILQNENIKKDLQNKLKAFSNINSIAKKAAELDVVKKYYEKIEENKPVNYEMPMDIIDKINEIKAKLSQYEALDSIKNHEIKGKLTELNDKINVQLKNIQDQDVDYEGLKNIHQGWQGIRTQVDELKQNYRLNIRELAEKRTEFWKTINHLRYLSQFGAQRAKVYNLEGDNFEEAKKAAEIYKITDKKLIQNEEVKEFNKLIENIKQAPIEDNFNKLNDFVNELPNALKQIKNEEVANAIRDKLARINAVYNKEIELPQELFEIIENEAPKITLENLQFKFDNNNKTFTQHLVDLGIKDTDSVQVARNILNNLNITELKETENNKIVDFLNKIKNDLKRIDELQNEAIDDQKAKEIEEILKNRELIEKIKNIEVIEEKLANFKKNKPIEFNLNSITGKLIAESGFQKMDELKLDENAKYIAAVHIYNIKKDYPWLNDDEIIQELPIDDIKAFSKPLKNKSRNELEKRADLLKNIIETGEILPNFNVFYGDVWEDNFEKLVKINDEKGINAVKLLINSKNIEEDAEKLGNADLNGIKNGTHALAAVQKVFSLMVDKNKAEKFGEYVKNIKNMDEEKAKIFTNLFYILGDEYNQFDKIEEMIKKVNENEFKPNILSILEDIKNRKKIAGSAEFTLNDILEINNQKVDFEVYKKYFEAGGGASVKKITKAIESTGIQLNMNLIEFLAKTGIKDAKKIKEINEWLQKDANNVNVLKNVMNYLPIDKRVEKPNEKWDKMLNLMKIEKGDIEDKLAVAWLCDSDISKKVVENIQLLTIFSQLARLGAKNETFEKVEKLDGSLKNTLISKLNELPQKYQNSIETLDIDSLINDIINDIKNIEKYAKKTEESDIKEYKKRIKNIPKTYKDKIEKILEKENIAKIILKNDPDKKGVGIFANIAGKGLTNALLSLEKEDIENIMQDFALNVKNNGRGLAVNSVLEAIGREAVKSKLNNGTQFNKIINFSNSAKDKVAFWNGFFNGINAINNVGDELLDKLAYTYPKYDAVAKNYEMIEEIVKGNKKIDDNKIIENLQFIREFANTCAFEANKFIKIKSDKPTIYVGDLHGSYNTLNEFLNSKYDDKKIDELLKNGEINVVFLGDYMDRGGESVNTLLKALSMSMIYPNNVFVLKGNHEDAIINESYGPDVLRKPENSEARNVLQTIYDKLPTMIQINDELAAHGFPPILNNDSKIVDLNNLNVEDLENDILWSDPTWSISGGGDNKRGAGKLINAGQIDAFMKKNNIKKIFRGHQEFGAGKGVKNNLRNMELNNGNVFNVFTAVEYYDAAPMFCVSERKDVKSFELKNQSLENADFGKKIDIKRNEKLVSSFENLNSDYSPNSKLGIAKAIKEMLEVDLEIKEDINDKEDVKMGEFNFYDWGDLKEKCEIEVANFKIEDNAVYLVVGKNGRPYVLSGIQDKKIITLAYDQINKKISEMEIEMETGDKIIKISKKTTGGAVPPISVVPKKEEKIEQLKEKAVKIDENLKEELEKAFNEIEKLYSKNEVMKKFVDEGYIESLKNNTIAINNFIELAKGSVTEKDLEITTDWKMSCVYNSLYMAAAKIEPKLKEYYESKKKTNKNYTTADAVIDYAKDKGWENELKEIEGSGGNKYWGVKDGENYKMITNHHYMRYLQKLNENIETRDAGQLFSKKNVKNWNIAKQTDLLNILTNGLKNGPILFVDGLYAYLITGIKVDNNKIRLKINDPHGQNNSQLFNENTSDINNGRFVKDEPGLKFWEDFDKFWELLEKKDANSEISLVGIYPKNIGEKDELAELKESIEKVENQNIKNKLKELVKQNKKDDAENMLKDYNEFLEKLGKKTKLDIIKINDNAFQKIKNYILDKYAENKDDAEKLLKMINDDWIESIFNDVKDQEKLIKTFEAMLQNKWEPDSIATSLHLLLQQYMNDDKKILERIDKQKKIKLPDKIDIEDYKNYAKFLAIAKPDEITQENVTKIFEKITSDKDFVNELMELKEETLFDEIMKIGMDDNAEWLTGDTGDFKNNLDTKLSDIKDSNWFKKELGLNKTKWDTIIESVGKERQRIHKYMPIYLITMLKMKVGTFGLTSLTDFFYERTRNNFFENMTISQAKKYYAKFKEKFDVAENKDINLEWMNNIEKEIAENKNVQSEKVETQKDEVPKVKYPKLKEVLKSVLNEEREKDLDENVIAYRIYSAKQTNREKFDEKELNKCKAYQKWINEQYKDKDEKHRQKIAHALSAFYSKISDNLSDKINKLDLDKYVEIKNENKENDKYINKIITLIDEGKQENARKLMDAGKIIQFPDNFNFDNYEYFINAFDGLDVKEKTQENANKIVELINLTKNINDKLEESNQIKTELFKKIFTTNKNKEINEIEKILNGINNVVNKILNNAEKIENEQKKKLAISINIKKMIENIKNTIEVNEQTNYTDFAKVYNLINDMLKIENTKANKIKEFLIKKSEKSVPLDTLIQISKNKIAEQELKLKEMQDEINKQYEINEKISEELEEADKEILQEIVDAGGKIENIQDFEKLKEYKLAGGEFTADNIPIVVKINNAKDAKLLLNRETEDWVEWINNIGGTAAEIYLSGTIADELKDKANEAAKNMAKEIESLDVDKQENAKEIAKKLFEKGMWEVEPNIFKKMTKLPINQLSIVLNKVSEIDKVKDICLAISTLENKEIKEKNVKEIINWDNDRLALTAKIIAEKDIENVKFENLEKIFKTKKINETQIAVLLGAINGKKYGDIFKKMDEFENVKNPFELGQELAKLEKIDKNTINEKVKEWQEK